MSSTGHILLEDCRIIFRNFSGKEGKYNREGDRNFCVLLDPEFAAQLDSDGWNVKALRAREEGDPDQPYLQVSVGFKNRPPLIVMITSRGRTTITEDELDILDWIDIKHVDMTIRPYSWSVRDNTGIKAYLKSLFITIEEDELQIKYADIPEANSRRIIDAEVIEQMALPSGGKTKE
jgi:hypothetical protein